MSRRTLILLAFAATCAVQLAVPVTTIVRYERTLHEGRAFRFKTAPVDPYDAFRGRYVQLMLDAATMTEMAAQDFESGDRVYAVVEEGADGFARFARLERRPPDGVPYVTAKIAWGGPDTVRLDLPIDRYYMEEKLAPEAERAYREHTGAQQADAYVSVRVLDGRAVLEELYVAGVPIHEYLRQRHP